MYTNGEVADHLDETADTLLVDGWCQGLFRDPVSGARCLVGSAAKDSNKMGLADLSAEAMGFYTFSQMIAWNDAPSTTEDMVHDLLRNTAKKLRDGEISL